MRVCKVKEVVRRVGYNRKGENGDDSGIGRSFCF
jgi:hypothetical protein